MQKAADEIKQNYVPMAVIEEIKKAIVSESTTEEECDEWQDGFDEGLKRAAWLIDRHIGKEKK